MATESGHGFLPFVAQSFDVAVLGDSFTLMITTSHVSLLNIDYIVVIVVTYCLIWLGWQEICKVCEHEDGKGAMPLQLVVWQRQLGVYVLFVKQLLHDIS